MKKTKIFEQKFFIFKKLISLSPIFGFRTSYNCVNKVHNNSSRIDFLIIVLLLSMSSAFAQDKIEITPDSCNDVKWYNASATLKTNLYFATTTPSLDIEFATHKFLEGQISKGAVSDSVKVTIHFRINSDVIDTSYMNNREALALLDRFVSNYSTSSLDTIIIAALSSPEGNSDFNTLLAQSRLESIYEYIINTYPILIKTTIDGQFHPLSWDDIREAIESDSNIPDSHELMRIIDNVGVSESEKEVQIRTIAGGDTFNYLLRNILPYVRKGMVTLRLSKTEFEPAVTEEKVVKPAVAEEKKERSSNIFALRSNLLSDLILAPDIGIEVPVGRHFSVAGDFTYAYWQTKSDRFALQIIQGNIEGRYWFGWKDNPLTGWNMGIYGSLGGRYDIQWKSGYQGDRFWTTGVVGGYSFPLSKTFNLDLSLAAGYLKTPEVRRYTQPQEGHLIWKETRYNTGLFTLTKARVSLVWLLGTRKQ